MTGDTHTCPARGCPREVADRFLMCGDHWRMVPRHLQQAVYTAYRCGDPGTLRRVQADAVTAVNKRLEPGL